MATLKQLQQKAKMNDTKIIRIQKELKIATARRQEIKSDLVKARAKAKEAMDLKKAKVKAIAEKKKMASKKVVSKKRFR